MKSIIMGKLTAIVCILLVFSVGVIGYMIFSADKPDGLEQTIVEAGIEEPESHYDAPLDYGDTYIEYVIMGAIGFFVVLLVSLAIARLMARKNET